MKKILLVCGLIFITGCSNPAKSLQANLFDDLWNNFVTKENNSIVTNKITNNITYKNRENFAKLNNSINDLREFLILGNFKTKENNIPLRKYKKKLHIKYLSRVKCTDKLNQNNEVLETNCFISENDINEKLFCFNEDDQKLKYAKQKIKYCEFREEIKFDEGLMPLADTYNEDLISELKKTIDVFDKNKLSKKSLKREIKKIKKQINKACQKQKSSVKCNL